ncbi:MAG: KH domain-containing protein [Nitrososphaera sp.]|jgi:ribosomal RNA assembly protein
MSFAHNIKIPRERIGALIGKGGRVKQDIEKRCGVAIEVDSEDGNALITGEKPVEQMEMFKAVEIISAIARGFSPQRAMRLMEEEEAMFQAIDLHDYAGKSPSALERIKGRIIGEAGKSRRTIEGLTGAYISVYGHTIGLIGNYNEIKLATDAIDLLCRGSMHKTVYNMLQEARRREKLDRMHLWEDSSNNNDINSEMKDDEEDSLDNSSSS